MKSFCCVYTLRDGGIASAWYTMGAELIWLVQILHDIRHSSIDQHANSNLAGVDSKETLRGDVTLLFIEAAAHCILWLTAGLMLMGIFKERAGLLLPWISTNAVMITYLTVGIFRSIAFIPAQTALSSDSVAAIFTFSIGLEVVFTNIYCVVCVASLHSQMLSSRTVECIKVSSTSSYSEKGQQLKLMDGGSVTKLAYTEDELPPAYTAKMMTDYQTTPLIMAVTEEPTTSTTPDTSNEESTTLLHGIGGSIII